MGLAPGDFWSLTPAEWDWLSAAARGGEAAPAPADFAALAALYPDDREDAR